MSLKPKQINVTVISVDTRLEFGIQKSSTGKHLFDQVAKTLNIREIWYFGLQYVDKDGDNCWLKLDKKICSQVDQKSKDKKMEFFFRVKYFPEDVVEELIEDVTKDFFFLQVRSSILSGSVYCAAETSVLLASYVCQIRLGDYEEPKLGKMPSVDKMLPKEIMEKHKLSSEEWLERIVHCYKAHMGMCREDAVMEFLKICQDLEMYGVTYFLIKNKKGTELWLGVDSMGLNIYEKDDKLTPKVGFPWGEVKHISYSGKKFLLKPTDKTAKEWHFFVDRVRTNRQILALSIGNHELYMRRRSPESIEVQQMKRKAQEAREERLRQKEQAQAQIEALRREAEQNRLAQEQAQFKISQFENQMLELTKALDLERRSRIELENMQEELRNMNTHLEKHVVETDEEKRQLLEDREDLKNRVKQQQQELEAQEQKKLLLNQQILEARQAATQKEQEVAVLAASNNNIHHNHNLANGDANNNYDDTSVCSSSTDEAISWNVFDFSEKDDDGKELQVMENYSRREEQRDTAVSKNKQLQFVLTSLRQDLNRSMEETKKSHLDRKYEENQRKGMDKFKTLRDIRKGNTKKRIDEFEAM